MMIIAQVFAAVIMTFFAAVTIGVWLFAPDIDQLRSEAEKASEPVEGLE